MASLLADRAALFFLCDDLFSDNVEIRFMGAEPKHDQVSICTVETVFCVWIIVFWVSLDSDEVKDFVLAFSWDASIWENYL